MTKPEISLGAPLCFLLLSFPSSAPPFFSSSFFFLQKIGVALSISFNRIIECQGKLYTQFL